MVNQYFRKRMLHFFRYADQEALKNKKIYVWGSQEGAIHAAMILDELKIDFIGFVDNDTRLKSKRLKGYYHKEIYYAEDILSKFDADIMFILVRVNHTEIIMKQILQYQFSIDQIFNPFEIRPVIFITNRCNLKCRFCPIHGKNKGVYSIHCDDQDMKLEMAQVAIDQLAKDNIVLSICAHGEPLLHEDFLSILSYAYQRFCIVTVTTNGLALNTQMTDELLKIEFQETKSIVFSFSVTGFSAETYNQFQGSGQTNNNTKRNKIYENINYLIDKRDMNKISKDKLKVKATYILNPEEDNYYDLKQYINYWEDRMDFVMITPERNYPLDIEQTHQYKNDDDIQFLCSFIHGKTVYSDGIGVCCETFLESGSKIGEVLDEDSWQTVNARHREIRENLLQGKYPEFCRGCYNRNTYTTGFPSKIFKDIISNISIVKDFFKNKKIVLFYGLNVYQRTLYTIVKGEGIIDRGNIVVIDTVAEGYFHDKRILRPTLENLRGGDMIVFDENSFMELDIDIINSLNSWVSYIDFI